MVEYNKLENFGIRNHRPFFCYFARLVGSSALMPISSHDFAFFCARASPDLCEEGILEQVCDVKYIQKKKVVTIEIVRKYLLCVITMMTHKSVSLRRIAKVYSEEECYIDRYMVRLLS
jgi:hypothetical protein